MSPIRFATAAVALFFPAALAAQICTGNPSLSTTAGNVGVGASFLDGGKGYGVSGTIGGRLFLTAGFTHFDFDDADLSPRTVSTGVGLEVAPAASRIRLCPGAAVSYRSGLEILGIDVTTLTFAPLLAVGIETRISPSVSVIPYAQGAVLFQRVSAAAGPLADAPASETNGSLAVGMSAVVNRILSIGPSVNIPIAAHTGDTTFGVSATIAFHRSR